MLVNFWFENLWSHDLELRNFNYEKPRILQIYDQVNQSGNELLNKNHRMVSVKAMPFWWPQMAMMLNDSNAKADIWRVCLSQIVHILKSGGCWAGVCFRLACLEVVHIYEVNYPLTGWRPLIFWIQNLYLKTLIQSPVSFPENTDNRPWSTTKKFD